MVDQLPNEGRRKFIKATTAGSVMGLAGCLTGENGSGGGDGGTGDGDSDEAEVDFPTDDLRWIVGASPGGGFDTYSRGVVQFLPDHLPNDVDIAVENVEPPRSGLLETFRAESDGHTIGSWPALGFVAEEIVTNTNYSMQEFTWLARIDETRYIYVGNSEYDGIQDLVNEDSPRISTPGAGTTAWLSTLVSTQVLGLEDWELVNFGGTSEAVSAVLRGDADAALGPMTSPSVSEPINAGDVQPLMSFTEEPVEDVGSPPTAVDEGYEEMLDFNLIRPVAGPPDIDEPVRDVLVESLMDTLESEEMQQWSEENNQPIGPAPGDEVAESIENAFNTLSEYDGLLEENIDV